jgi:predicted  nucleic acid-binding Zn-ribbon protein
MTAGPLLFRGNPVTSVAELYALQDLDQALEAKRAALADAQSRLGEPEELAEVRRTVIERQEGLRTAEKRFKEQEWEADELRHKIEPVEQRLYQGNVQNPKELEDLERDVESLKRRRSDLEDKALEAMEVLEQAQQALDAAQRELQELTQSSGAEQEELHGRQASLKDEIALLEQQRAEQATRIEGSSLQLYDRLYAVRQHRPVAKVEGGACQGCRISLPMNLLHRARSGGDLVQCSSCERILYVS